MNGRHNVHATHDKSLQCGQERLIKTALNHHFDQGMFNTHNHNQVNAHLCQARKCPFFGASALNENPIKNPEMKDYSLQVELAFRKFDLDRDGFLSWDEFRQVRTFLFILCVLVFCVGLEVTFHALRSGVLTLTFTCILGLQVGGVLVFCYSDIDKGGLVD